MRLGFGFSIPPFLSSGEGAPAPEPGGLQPIPGILNAPNVIVLGASHAARSFGTRSALAAGVADKFAVMGFGGTIHSYAVAATTIAGAVSQYNDARVVPAIAATEGQNVYLIDSGGNDIMGNLPYPTKAADVDAQMRALVASIQARGDRAVVLPQTKRYAPWSGLVEGDNLETQGMLPYNQQVYYPLIADLTPEMMRPDGLPKINPYELADLHRLILSSDGNHGYGHTLSSYDLGYLAAAARGIDPLASRAGKAIIVTFPAQGASYVPGQYNVWRSHYVGSDALNQYGLNVDAFAVGAGYYDGGYDAAITMRTGPLIAQTTAGPGVAGAGRVADPRLKVAAVLDGGIFTQNEIATHVTINRLTPGDVMQIGVVAARGATGANRKGNYTITGGQTAVIDSATTAASNYHQFEPITVPENGEIRLDWAAVGGSGYAALSAIALDFL